MKIRSFLKNSGAAVLHILQGRIFQKAEVDSLHSSTQQKVGEKSRLGYTTVVNCVRLFPQSIFYSVAIHIGALVVVVGVAGHGSSSNQTGQVFDIQLEGTSTISSAEKFPSRSDLNPRKVASNSNEQVAAEPQNKLRSTVSADMSLEKIRQKIIKKSETKLLRSSLATSAIEKELSKEANSPLSGRSQAGTGATVEAAEPIARNGSGNILGMQEAHVQFAPKPFFPTSARRAGFEGSVELEVQVTESGLVSEASVSRSSGRTDCDESARTTIVERWRFVPALRSGLPVPSRERVIVSYRLQ